MTPRRDDDTDPELSRSGSWRVPPSTPEESALTPSALGALRFLMLAGLILTAAAAMGGVSYALAQVAAERVVAPVKKAVEDHELGLAGKRQIMDMKTESFERALVRIEAKLDRVCAASARPAVCLGGGE